MTEKKPNKKKTERPAFQYEKIAEGIYAINFKSTLNKMKYTKEQIFALLEQENDSKLRDASHYFYNISGEYRSLITYYANILTFDNLIIPSAKNKSNLSKDKFRDDFQKILDYCDNSYIPEASAFISAVIMMDGIFYGYERINGETITLQQLPPSYCRSKYKINDNYAVEFNLKFFDQYRDTEQKINLFKLFPDEFFGLYMDYKNGESIEWVQLNPEFARCHKISDKQIPPLSPVFTELINLKEYKDIDKSKNEMDLYRLIVQKIPTDKDTGEPLLTLPEAQELHKNAKKMITQEGLDVLTTPLPVEAINLQEKGQTLRDNLERATNSVYNTSTTSRLLFNSGSDGGSIGLTHSIKVDEVLMKPLLGQFKKWYEKKFKYLLGNTKNYRFEIMFPLITIFNRKEMFALYKEAATLGYSKLLPLTALGIKQSTFMNLLDFENDYLKLHEKMIPLQTSYTQNGEDGSPEKEIEDLTDKGLKTRTTEANKNRAK